MTADILTPGHIKCLKFLRDYKGQMHPFIIIGLLTNKALKGYKNPVMSFKDRKYILENLDVKYHHLECIDIVSQNSLDPSKNIEKYKPVAIASGDGWEKEELEAIKKYNLIKINIRLKGEKKKKYSSSKLKVNRSFNKGGVK